MTKHCLKNQHDFKNVTLDIKHKCVKGRLLNRLEEVEAVAVAAGTDKLLKDMNSLYITPFVFF